MSTPTAAPPVPLTADEFAARYGNHRMELELGAIKVLPMPGALHGKVCMTLGWLIAGHVRERDLGHVMSNDTFIQTRTSPDTVRGADVLYVSYDRLPRGQVPEGVLRVAPEVVVEIRSPSDRWSEVIVKVGEYLQIGVKLVVVLDVVTATVSLFRDQDPWQQTLDNGDTLDLGEVLPGFTLPVRQLFEA